MDRGMTLVVNETSASYLSHHADNTGRMTMPRSRFDCFQLCTQLICTKLRGRTSNMRMPCQGIGPRCRAKAEVCCTLRNLRNECHHYNSARGARSPSPATDGSADGRGVLLPVNAFRDILAYLAGFYCCYRSIGLQCPSTLMVWCLAETRRARHFAIRSTARRLRPAPPQSRAPYCC